MSSVASKIPTDLGQIAAVGDMQQEKPSLIECQIDSGGVRASAPGARCQVSPRARVRPALVLTKHPTLPPCSVRLLQDTGDDAHRGGRPAPGGLPRHALLPALRGLPGAGLALQAAGGAAREVNPHPSNT